MIPHLQIQFYQYSFLSDLLYVLGYSLFYTLSEEAERRILLAVISIINTMDLTNSLCQNKI